jgi:PhnB protein
MELSPYLNFNGQCAEAFAFYAKCLGGRIISLLTHGQSPIKDQVAPEWRDKVLHARLDIGGQSVMGCDAPPSHYKPAQGLVVSITVPTASDADRVFHALSEDGKVTMPFQKTFWSAGFGMLVDRFGIPWMVNAEQQPA